MNYFIYIVIMSLLCAIDFTKSKESYSVQAAESESLKNSINIEDQKSLLTAPIYAKIFKERRREQNLIIKQMLRSRYEKNYKLLTMAYANIFDILNKNNLTLKLESYNITDQGFPTTSVLQEAVSSILENCCLAAVNVLHFPEISYRIFHLTKDFAWKEVLNWCISFVNALPHITDESTTTLIDLLLQEINVELRSENYQNPYYEKPPVQPEEVKITKKKQRKKLKKGPELRGGKNEL